MDVQTLAAALAIGERRKANLVAPEYDATSTYEIGSIVMYIQRAVQRFANQIKMFQRDPCADLAVHLADCGRSNPSHLCQLCLCPPLFVKKGGQVNPNHSDYPFAGMIAEGRFLRSILLDYNRIRY